MMGWETHPVEHANVFHPHPACYAVQIGGLTVYVGSTANLRDRFRAYGFRPCERDPQKTVTPWGRFSNITIKFSEGRRLGDWAAREIRLIAKLKPRFNRRGKGVRRYEH